tara:strand:- start:289 stop:1272 length:984 start_codon:yes stop_codon:yes gene_type:complete
MGIKNLYKLISDYSPNSITNKKISNYGNKIVVIDASLVIYQYVIAIRSTGKDLTNNNGDITTHIHGIINKTMMLLKYNIMPVYVFDGKAPKLKGFTLKNRKNLKNKNIKKLEDEDYDNEDDRIKIFKKCYTITKEHKIQIQEVLNLFGIPNFESTTEADTLCSLLVKKKLAYGCSTEDMDLLTFGCPILIRSLSQKKKAIEINLNQILKDFNMNQKQFIDLCILLGSDYCPTIPRIGPKRAYEVIQKYKSIDNFLKNESEKYNIPENFNYIETRNYFMNKEIYDIKDIEMNKPNTSEIFSLLKNEYNFTNKKITDFIEKLNIFYESQ